MLMHITAIWNFVLFCSVVMDPAARASSSSLALSERRVSRHGGCAGIIFHLFNWNKKKLFFRKLLPAVRAKDDEKLLARRVYGEESEQNQMREAGIVMRLMGLDTMPVLPQHLQKNIPQENTTKLVEYGEKIEPVINVLGSVLARSRKNHRKIPSPVKNPRITCRKGSSRLVSAATKILEPGLKMTARAKSALPCPNNHSNIMKEKRSVPQHNSSSGRNNLDKYNFAAYRSSVDVYPRRRQADQLQGYNEKDGDNGFLRKKDTKFSTPLASLRPANKRGDEETKKFDYGTRKSSLKCRHQKNCSDLKRCTSFKEIRTRNGDKNLVEDRRNALQRGGEHVARRTCSVAEITSSLVRSYDPANRFCCNNSPDSRFLCADFVSRIGEKKEESPDGVHLSPASVIGLSFSTDSCISGSSDNRQVQEPHAEQTSLSYEQLESELELLDSATSMHGRTDDCSLIVDEVRYSDHTDGNVSSIRFSDLTIENQKQDLLLDYAIGSSVRLCSELLCGEVGMRMCSWRGVWVRLRDDGLEDDTCQKVIGLDVQVLEICSEIHLHILHVLVDEIVTDLCK